MSASLSFSSLNMMAQKNVRANMQGVMDTSYKLMTGKRVNSPKDDPAAFIAGEYIKSENVEIKAKIKSNQAYGNMLSTKDSYLAQIGGLLNDIKGSVVEGANSGVLSDDQIDALQLQIDYAIDAIGRIANSATYKGEKLLEGLVSSLSLSMPENMFTNIEDTEIKGAVELDSQECLPCTGESRILQTDTLNALRTFFSLNGEEQEGLFSNLTTLLSRLASGTEAGIPDAEELDPEEETLEQKLGLEETEPEETAAEEVDSEEVVVETEQETTEQTTDEQNAAAQNGATAHPDQPENEFETFFRTENELSFPETRPLNQDKNENSIGLEIPTSVGVTELGLSEPDLLLADKSIEDIFAEQMLDDEEESEEEDEDAILPPLPGSPEELAESDSQPEAIAAAAAAATDLPETETAETEDEAAAGQETTATDTAKKKETETEEEEPEEPFLHSTATGYVFRMDHRFDFMNEVEEEPEERVMTMDVGLDVDTIESDIQSAMLGGAAMMHSMLAAKNETNNLNMLYEEEETEDIMGEEEEEDEDELMDDILQQESDKEGADPNGKLVPKSDLKPVEPGPATEQELREPDNKTESLSIPRSEAFQVNPDTEEEEEQKNYSGSLQDLKSGGSASLKNNPEKADAIIEQAMSSLFLMRAQIGAELKYTVDVNDELLKNKLYLNESELSSLTDADYALESAKLARYQLLLQSSMKVLQYTQTLPRMMLDILDTVTPS